MHEAVDRHVHMAMCTPITIIFGLLVCAGVWQHFQRAHARQQRALRERQFRCQPVHTIQNKPWYFGLDVAQSMSDEYLSGTRNSRLQAQFDTIGPTFRTHASDATRIFTVDPENVKAVFGGSPEQWGVEAIRLEAFRPAFGAGVLVTDGTRWKHARKPCQSVIDRVYRHRMADLSRLDAKIDELIRLIPTDGSTVDLNPILSDYMIDSATEYIFGTSVDSLKPGAAGDAGKQFRQATIYGLSASGERDELPQWTIAGIRSRWTNSGNDLAAFGLIHRVTDHYVQEALKHCDGISKGETQKVSLAHEWAKIVKDPVEIRDQLLNVLVAAFDTTAVTLQHAFFHLARNPSSYQKLRAEVTESPLNMTVDDLKGLRYLNNVIRETLRLNTPATFNSRMALSDTSIPRGGGVDGTAPVFVPKGDIVVTSIYSIQRNKAIYGEDAECFRPERWDVVQPRHWDYLPFGAGPRVCPGQYLALAHAAYVLCYLVRHYSTVECRDPVEELIEVYRVTTASRNGCQVALYTQ